MFKKNTVFIVLALILSSFVFFLVDTKTIEPKEVYRVYLEGETIGFIHSKEKLEKYIDNEQQDLKDKYKVNKVYTPNSLDIIKEISFTEKISTEEEIYEHIKDIAPFTIKGYAFTIKGEEITSDDNKTQQPDQKIYVLDKQIFIDATLKAMTSFITMNDYDAFINNKQEEIKETGSYIQEIYIRNKETVREENISADEKIYTSVEELARFLLFGTLETKKTYSVQENDTLTDIAYNNKLSNDEFLTVNPDFTSIDNLTYTGQVVDVTLINPLLLFVQKNYIVEDQVKKFNTKVEYDNNLASGVENEKQAGVDGLNRLTKTEVVVNGKVEKGEIESTVEIKPAVDKIVVKGTKYDIYTPDTHIPDGPVGIIGDWYWPTARPYIITSPFGWRWGRLHEGVDISGTGNGSPIYAANSGYVVEATYQWMNGNYVVIDHRNGYQSVYAHMSDLQVKKGENVTMGQRIGGMGMTGYATGVHLHFAIYKGQFYGGTPLNPLTLY